MKTTSILLSLIMVVLSRSSSAQINNDTLHSQQYYMQIANQYHFKSQHQKVTSNILGISGCILLVTGMTLAVTSLSGFSKPGAKYHDYGSAPDILAITGGTMIAVAIPYSIAYRANKKKANLYMQKASVVITPVINSSIHFTSVGIMISL